MAGRRAGREFKRSGAARGFSSGGGQNSMPMFVGGVVIGAGVLYGLRQMAPPPPVLKKKQSGSKSAPKIIISGAPGSGKGTQCENIVKKYGVVHISTGDVLREHVKNGTELGKTAKGHMEKGELVPDALVIAMVKDKLSDPAVASKGWLLDGFPRTPEQAKALGDLGVTADCFLQLEVPDSILVERICGRRTDPVTGKIYHLKFNPPPNDSTVINRLQHRKDDTEEALCTRLEQYHKNVNGIKDFYKDISREVNGHGNAGFKENVARVQGEIEDGIDSSRQH
jgi:adenylate kinase